MTNAVHGFWSVPGHEAPRDVRLDQLIAVHLCLRQGPLARAGPGGPGGVQASPHKGDAVSVGHSLKDAAHQGSIVFSGSVQILSKGLWLRLLPAAIVAGCSIENRYGSLPPEIARIEICASRA